MALELGGRTYGPGDLLIMAIVNRTPDSFYDKGASWSEDAAMSRVRSVIADGAEIVDIGGVKAGPGEFVSVEEEIRRTIPFVAAVRAEFPDVLISVDTWRHEIGEAACEAGADLLNDAWGGHDPELAAVAARRQVGLVCTHAGGAAPRTRPFRVEYDDVVADIIAVTTGLAERAVALGAPPRSVLIDAGHDFGKNTWHSLEATRRIGELCATGWPVLVSTSNKDFVGESLGRPVRERLHGSLATVAICAWAGAQVFRVHDVPQTRDVLDMVACVKGDREPVSTTRGLA